MTVETIRMPNGAIVAPVTQDEAHAMCAEGGLWTGQVVDIPDAEQKPEDEKSAGGNDAPKANKGRKPKASDAEQKPEDEK